MLAAMLDTRWDRRTQQPGMSFMVTLRIGPFLFSALWAGFELAASGNPVAIAALP